MFLLIVVVVVVVAAAVVFVVVVVVCLFVCFVCYGFLLFWGEGCGSFLVCSFVILVVLFFTLRQLVELSLCLSHVNCRYSQYCVIFDDNYKAHWNVCFSVKLC